MTLTLGFVRTIDKAGHLTVIELLVVYVVYVLVYSVEVLFHDRLKGIEEIVRFLLSLPW